MQSLSRMFRRNRAMLVIDNVTKGIEPVVKRGTHKNLWDTPKRYIFKNNPK